MLSVEAPEIYDDIQNIVGFLKVMLAYWQLCIAFPVCSIPPTPPPHPPSMTPPTQSTQTLNMRRSHSQSQQRKWEIFMTSWHRRSVLKYHVQF